MRQSRFALSRFLCKKAKKTEPFTHRKRGKYDESDKRTNLRATKENKRKIVCDCSEQLSSRALVWVFVEWNFSFTPLNVNLHVVVRIVWIVSM